MSKDRYIAISSNAKWLFWFLIENYCVIDEVSETQTELAKRAGMGIRSFRAACNELVEAKLLDKAFHKPAKEAPRCTFRIQHEMCFKGSFVGKNVTKWDSYSTAVFQIEGIKRLEKLVLLSLILNSDDDGFVVNLGLSDIGRMCGMSKERVKRYVNCLVSKGYLYQVTLGATGKGLFGLLPGSYTVNLMPIHNQCSYRIHKCTHQDVRDSVGIWHIVKYLEQVAREHAVELKMLSKYRDLSSSIPSTLLLNSYSKCGGGLKLTVHEMCKDLIEQISSKQIVGILQSHMDKTVTYVLNHHKNEVRNWVLEPMTIELISRYWREFVVPEQKVIALLDQAQGGDDLSYPETKSRTEDIERGDLLVHWFSQLVAYQALYVARCVHILCGASVDNATKLVFIGDDKEGRSWSIFRVVEMSQCDYEADTHMRKVNITRDKYQVIDLVRPPKLKHGENDSVI